MLSLLCRGALIAHPMEVEGPVAGFSPFHNINCAQVLHLAFKHVDWIAVMFGGSVSLARCLVRLLNECFMGDSV